MSYEWKTHHNSNGTEVQIAEVQESGDIQTYGGQAVKVRAGDLITRTENPDWYTVVTDAGDWTEGEFEGEAPVAEDDAPASAFDPSEHTVGDVKTYIDEQRAEGNTDEADRVLRAEAGTRNRAGLAEY